MGGGGKPPTPLNAPLPTLHPIHVRDISLFTFHEINT